MFRFCAKWHNFWGNLRKLCSTFFWWHFQQFIEWHNAGSLPPCPCLQSSYWFPGMTCQSYIILLPAFSRAIHCQVSLSHLSYPKGNWHSKTLAFLYCSLWRAPLETVIFKYSKSSILRLSLSDIICCYLEFCLKAFWNLCYQFTLNI